MRFLLLLAIPVVEIAVFIQVGSRIGAGLTLLLVLVSAVFGIGLIRAQGLATAARLQALILRGESPALGMLEGLALLVAGVLLLIPGFVTDLAAFILLVPPWRRKILHLFLRRFRLGRLVGGSDGGPPAPTGRPPLEGKARRED